MFLGVAASASAPAPKEFKTAKQLSAKIIAEQCTEAGAPAMGPVTVLKDKDGNIGGYYTQIPPMRDAPIVYFDCDGAELTTFHIFGSKKEKKKASAIIDALQRRFPLNETLDCRAARGAQR